MSVFKYFTPLDPEIETRCCIRLLVGNLGNTLKEIFEEGTSNCWTEHDWIYTCQIHMASLPNSFEIWKSLIIQNWMVHLVYHVLMCLHICIPQGHGRLQNQLQVTVHPFVLLYTERQQKYRAMWKVDKTLSAKTACFEQSHGAKGMITPVSK